jgi:hypothetical protein
MYPGKPSCKPKEASQFHANYFTAHNSCLKIRDASLQEKEIPGSAADPVNGYLIYMAWVMRRVRQYLFMKKPEQILIHNKKAFQGAPLKSFLIEHRNPGPLGQVRENWLCHKIVII